MEEHAKMQKEPKKVDIIILEDQQNEGEKIVTKDGKMTEERADMDWQAEVGEDILQHKSKGKDSGKNEDKKCEENVEMAELHNTQENVEMDGPQNSEENIGSGSSDSLSDDSDGKQTSASEDDGEISSEVPMTDAEIEELVAEFLEVENKAAEAQESLEKESLAKLESEVREELAENLHGDALEIAVSTEMKTYVDDWEAVLDDLETQSAILLEQLDGAGIELPRLYKWIESQVPHGCCTEAWKKRAHWVGSQLSGELSQSIRDAEDYLQSHRPVRRQHGKLLEEGASGYLMRKLSSEGRDNLTENSVESWSSFNEHIQSHKCSESTSFGSKNWASVYLASTPQQAASLGLMLPGIDEVEEIGDVECNSNDPFYADAIANEKDIDLSEEQKKNFRKVREEDDANLTRKLQHQLKRQRQRKKRDQVLIEEDVLDHILLKDHLQPDSKQPKSSEDCVANDDNGDNFSKKLQSDLVDSSETEKESPKVNGSCKRSLDVKEEEADNKRHRTVIIDSDDELPVVENKFGSTVSHVLDNVLLSSSSEAKKVVDVIDVDILPSPSSSNHDFWTKNDVKEYLCTACYDVLKACEVQRHPKLQVIVCQSCKLLVEEKTKLKDLISGGFCEWCAKCKDLISCNSCKMPFCTICISRNFGEECLSEAKASGWQCCCCSPVQLQRFIMDCDAALNGLVVSSSGSETDISDGAIDIPIRNKKRRKKKIRRILDDAELGEDTKEKIAIEKARQDHLKSMQLQSANKTWCTTLSNINGNAIEGAKAGILGDGTEGYIVNAAREEDEEPVRIPPSISSKLKPHQVAGIQFMWENIVQSVKKVKAGDKGLGCILAHTMGLGKTFQIIAFLYTAMRCVNLGLKTALIVTPVNVLHNWRQEFLKWQPTELKPLRVLMLEDVAREKRAYLLAKWRAKGGVLLIGYAAFRNLSLGRHVKDRHTASEICHCLQDGPDILVCDEAHMIKNTKADITQALKQVKTQRRIALTGSPLQNNLMEYYCMVDFVREGFLGSSLEFRNRFQNPIENGQHTNSTSEDVKIMNQRSHILYEQLKGFVQRMDTSVVKRDLPPKTVFVITVKLSPLQRKLYKRFLDVHGFTSDKENSDKTSRRRCFFAGYQALAQIWNHPGVLQMAKEHKDNLRREDALENFFGDDSSSDENVEYSDLLNGEKQRSKPDSLSKKNDSAFNNEEIDWWEDLLREKIYKEVDYSGKMVLLLDILSMSSEAGDKALVFSQSLTTLDMIELFLSKLPQKGTEGKYWKQGKDWYRFDGRTDGLERQKLVERFNEPSNTRVKCTLISTRAGSLGINLHAANRVVLVDGSWNPTHDLQAIFRVWRYGQNKPVYAYRLMAHGTMEEKIYKRQVTKEGLAARVVDRQQIHRTMSKEEILHLFDFGDEENADLLDQSQDSLMMSNPKPKHNLLPLSNGVSCSDKFMESLLSRHYPRWIANYHEHETLLQENEAEKLSKEEQDLAWKLYLQSLEWEVQRVATFDDHERKPAIHSTPPESSAPQHTKASSRNHSGHQKKCTNLAHMLTLRSKQIKSGESTTCGECSEEISWENLNRDGKSR